MAVAHGVDEVALAFTSDAWSPTYRSRARAVRARAPEFQAAAHADGITTLGGFVLTPYRPGTDRALMVVPHDVPSSAALDTALARIRARYGARTAGLVALQLAYARPH